MNTSQLSSPIEPKILKGTRDFMPKDMAKRNFVLQKMRKIFELFGYDTIETPIINYAETILGKYGEEGNRLTYNFEDNGGRRIALPYDLTVPFARFFAANYGSLPIPFKRYQIQRVWRAEKPQKGRLREFYQCDIDIIGTKSLLAEAEIAKMIVAVFEALGFENFLIQINSRKLMNAILRSFEVAEEQSQNVIRILDKLEKIGREETIGELIEVGFEARKAADLLNLLQCEEDNQKTLLKLSSFDTAELQEFFSLSKKFTIPQKYFKLNPSLARGLDYYTGLVFEVILPDLDLGSVCGGGRYDDLCGLFCREKFSGIGVAFGFERIMIALEELGKLQNISLNASVLVTLFDAECVGDSLRLYELLLQAGINSEIYFQKDKLSKQFQYANKKEIPFVLVRGPDERKNDTVSLKSLKTGKQKILPVSQLISYFKGYE